MHGVPRLSSRGNPALEHQKVLSPSAWNVLRPQWQGGGTRDLLVTEHPYWEGGVGGGCSLPTGPLHPPSPSSLTSHVTGHGFWEGLPPAHPRISWGRRGPLGTDDLPSPPLAGQVPSPHDVLTLRRAVPTPDSWGCCASRSRELCWLSPCWEKQLCRRQ